MLVKTDELSESGVCVCTAEELEQACFSFLPQTLEECTRPGPAKLESYEGYDFILINVLSGEKRPSVTRMGLYLTPERLVFVCRRPCKTVQSTLEAYQKEKTAGLNITRVLYSFFLGLIAGDSNRLESFEEEVAALEENIMENREEDCTRRIFEMRKRLMFYKKYYEQLLDVAEGMEENANRILSSGGMRYFRIFTGRVDRLNRSVLNLRDYITQVREAYQSQVDIKLNEIMKLFTVVTAIFLPLSLLVGWYGMNFINMPELTWPYGYAAAIAVSVLFVVASIVYFKKRKIL